MCNTAMLRENAAFAFQRHRILSDKNVFRGNVMNICLFLLFTVEKDKHYNFQVLIHKLLTDCLFLEKIPLEM